MNYGISVGLIKGWIRMKKGYTLIEVILAITLISIVAICFIPAITFGYTKLLETEKYIVDSFKHQGKIEEKIEEKRKENPIGTGTFEKDIFGVSVKGHEINMKVEEHGEINVFVTMEDSNMKYPVPKLMAKGHTGNPNIVLLDVKENLTKLNPTPKKINMFIDDELNSTINLLADENKFQVDDTSIHLVNVYKWYISPMIEYKDGYTISNHFIIKEWNAARKELTYEESRDFGFTPNIQDNPDYNTFKLQEVIQGLELSYEQLINEFGNRFINYSVTPYAISGKIGKEEISNSVYIRAPRIEIEKAIFGPEENQVSIYFKDSIRDTINYNNINLNKDLGKLIGASIDSNNDKILILEFEQELDQNVIINKNSLGIGAVESVKYGKINIWSKEDPSGEFEIVKE